MKRRGFTLVELLVVIAIIALLMGILMPALNRVKQIAYRMVCGTNLSGIGKTMMIYSNDYDEEYPVAGGPTAVWGVTNNWLGTTETISFGQQGYNSATIAASFYVLIKHTDTTPGQFICKGDSGTGKFKLTGTGAPAGTTLEEVWDFGGLPGTTNETPIPPGLYCSYSYHLPYYKSTRDRGFPITPTSSPSSPLCADRNPYLDRNAEAYTDGKLDGEDAPTCAYDEYYDPDKTGNSASHQRDGQNVLFNDSHVNFEPYPNVGIENDNIWKYWLSANPTWQERQCGGGRPTTPTSGGSPAVPGEEPLAEEDAYLVNEWNG